MSDPRETTERSAPAEQSGSDGEQLQAFTTGDDAQVPPTAQLAEADQQLSGDEYPDRYPSVDLAAEEEEELLVAQQNPDGDTAVDPSIVDDGQ